MAAYDEGWARQVVEAVDARLATVDVGFTSQVSRDGGEIALLWEAEPALFAARFPDSGIVESYGRSWSRVPCIDFWVHVDPAAAEAATSFEGWSGRDRVVGLSGDAEADALTIGRLLADHLGLGLPEQS